MAIFALKILLPTSSAEPAELSSSTISVEEVVLMAKMGMIQELEQDLAAKKLLRAPNQAEIEFLKPKLSNRMMERLMDPSRRATQAEADLFLTRQSQAEEFNRLTERTPNPKPKKPRTSVHHSPVPGYDQYGIPIPTAPEKKPEEYSKTDKKLSSLMISARDAPWRSRGLDNGQGYRAAYVRRVRDLEAKEEGNARRARYSEEHYAREKLQLEKQARDAEERARAEEYKRNQELAVVRLKQQQALEKKEAKVEQEKRRDLIVWP